MVNLVNTIAAVSTAPGIAGIAVIRVSGPAAASSLVAVAGSLPRPRRASMARLSHPVSRETLDQALVLWFPGPHSFTGDDVAEFHVHGGRAVVAAVLRAILEIDGVRPAEPGEFTRRAFEHGKLDLTAVEGLSDLLAAETEAQRRQAVAQLQGRVADAVAELQNRLRTAQALVEASIDFSEEGDVGADIAAGARSHIESLANELETLLRDSERGEKIRDGVTIAIAGPPNAGKSTLLNALAKRDVAIVSPVAGTTRDIIELHLDLGGVSAVLLDTAGIRDAGDAIEAEGIRRSKARAAAADLVLWLHAGDVGDRPSDFKQADVWSIRTQIDLTPGVVGASHHRISARTGQGMAEFVDALTRFAEERAGGEPAVLVRERHRRIFAEARDACREVLTINDWGGQADIVAEHLRAASAALGRASGRSGSEAVLDVIFSSFCIGK